MHLTVRTIQSSDEHLWDNYVLSSTRSELYHLSKWKNIIEKAYGHKTYYLMAVKNVKPANGQDKIAGVLPLVHLKHFLFGNKLISIPFFDMGGVLADDEKTEIALIEKAINIAEKIKAKTIELRHFRPIKWINDADKLETESLLYKNLATNNNLKSINFATQTNKVRMLLDPLDSSDELMKSFKSKLRNHIKKPIKAGFTTKIGKKELIEPFYDVFSANMRDLGSPVHSINIIRQVLDKFKKDATIFIVYNKDKPIACSFVAGFKKTLLNPWASALREYKNKAPNMLLYWTMLEYACDNGYNVFDFGRSSPDSGTYNFKKQWGAKPFPLYWNFIYLNRNINISETFDKSKFDKIINIWQKLPVSVTRIAGPMIRKHIGL